MTSSLISETALQQLTQLAQTLYSAIDSGDQAQILSAQQALSAKAAEVWSQVDQEQVTARDKAVARVLADMATHGLPQAVQDPANYPNIQHELRLLKNSLVLLK